MVRTRLASVTCPELSSEARELSAAERLGWMRGSVLGIDRPLTPAVELVGLRAGAVGDFDDFACVFPQSPSPTRGEWIQRYHPP